jgi:hypothetical protein
MQQELTVSKHYQGSCPNSGRFPLEALEPAQRGVFRHFAVPDPHRHDEDLCSHRGQYGRRIERLDMY